jgi:hypothetical protein
MNINKKVCAITIATILGTCAIQVHADDTATPSSSEKVRHTKDEKRQHAREKSKSATSSTKQSSDQKSDNSFTVEDNINSLLIKTFIDHYESGSNSGSGPGWLSGLSTSIPDYYNTPQGQHALEWLRSVARNDLIAQNGLDVTPDYHCKPFSNISYDFPVFFRLTVGRAGEANGSPELDKIRSSNTLASIGYKAVFDYVVCRVEANIILTAAGDFVAHQGQVFSSERDVSEQIDEFFHEIDSSQEIQDKIIAGTDDIMNQVSCSGALPHIGVSNDLTLNCGVFYANAGSGEFRIFGRQTMSSSAIDGKSYKVSISQGNSENSGASLESSDSTKDSTSTSTGSGVDTSSEFNRAK